MSKQDEAVQKIYNDVVEKIREYMNMEAHHEVTPGTYYDVCVSTDGDVILGQDVSERWALPPDNPDDPQSLKIWGKTAPHPCCDDGDPDDCTYSDEDVLCYAGLRPIEVMEWVEEWIQDGNLVTLR